MTAQNKRVRNDLDIPSSFHPPFLACADQKSSQNMPPTHPRPHQGRIPHPFFLSRRTSSFLHHRSTRHTQIQFAETWWTRWPWQSHWQWRAYLGGKRERDD